MQEIKEITEEDMIKARRAYQKQWRDKNKDKCKEYNLRWLKKRAAAVKGCE